MANGNEQLVATRLPIAETFFDPKATYSLEDWLFRVNLYYEMLLCMTGPNGVNASEREMETMLATLNLIHWAETLPPNCKIGYETGEDGLVHSYPIMPRVEYLM